MTEATKPQEPEKTQETPWVMPEDRVLDPTLLKKSLVERMPQPTGWRVLVLPYKGKAKTAGGIYSSGSSCSNERNIHPSGLHVLNWVLSHTKMRKNFPAVSGVKKAIG